MTGTAPAPETGGVRRAQRLTSAEVAEVLSLADAAADTDGADPLSEHVVLQVRHGGEAAAVHLLSAAPGGGLAGYAHVDVADPVDGPAAELVVHPMHRRRGLGRALMRAAVGVAEQADPRGRLRLWAHGDHPSASALALSSGFERTRVLWQMRRSLLTPVPAPQLPPGIRLRPFEPGRDEHAWLAVNARAFADHPDQGRWTAEDLRLRMAEPWFEPAGFLLAVVEGGQRDGEIAGFHWTKVHGGDGGGHQHAAVGEIYVLGVDPSAHGLGLGTALSLAGLRHLRGRGLGQAMLYVDESNRAAVALYTKIGFARWTTDVSFRRATA
ncbi:mycothiol synthase [Rhizomonospora bruguierae]|uniref:mycothiol synthase n=1 Tax=Rhizomonospora bruguierae TaxID=1581705 RepID=UPI001BCEDD2A|nr:mycothiol synthase [Micromonospora sp. NBRC 107566]